jgi:branched-chain amino acid transport system ATP-binding protein
MSALELADRAYVVDHGRVTKSGPAVNLASDPAIREAYMGLS